jgi:histidinol-phosphate aminotransferase
VVVRVRRLVDAIPDYTPGRDADVAAREQGLDRAIKLASNELSCPPPESVQRAIADAVGRVHRYPDDAGIALRERLAETTGVAVEQVVLGAGSVALCQQAVLAVTEPGEEVMWSQPSFEAYAVIARQAGARVVAPPLRDRRYALDEMAAAVSAQTRAIFVCNPNNPTGTIVDAAELAAFLARVPQDILIILDEAYHEFVRDERAPDGLDVIRAHPNVLVLRTFSKAYGLAGLRVGYGIGAPKVVGALRRMRQLFGVSSVALAAARAALDAQTEVRAVVDAVVSERTRVSAVLATDLGLDVPASEANFVWIDVGERALDVAAACERRGVVLRPFARLGVRATIGTTHENDMMLAALGESLAECRA